MLFSQGFNSQFKLFRRQKWLSKKTFLKKKKSVSLHRYVVLPIKYVHSIMECYSQADDYLKPQPVSSVEI